MDSFIDHIEPQKQDAKNLTAGLMKKLLKTRRPSKDANKAAAKSTPLSDLPLEA